MATDFDRDDRLHGLLRDTLRSRPTSGPCIDAAALAAWTDGALTPEDTAATDAHLATCPRCRELAATFSMMPEAEAAPAAAVVPFTPRANGRWKVVVGAVGTVAASVLIWVAVRDAAPSLDTTPENIRAEQNQARGVGAPPEASMRALEDAKALQRSEAARGAERLQGQQGQRAPGTPAPEAKLARDNAARTAEPAQSSAKPSPAPVEPPARSAAPPPPAAVAAPIPPPPAAPPAAATIGNARVTGPPQSTINIAIDPARQSDLLRSSETFFAPPPIVAEFVAGAERQAAQGQRFGGVADRSRAAGAGRGGGGSGAGAVRQEAGASASAPPVQWRIHGPSPLPDFPSIAALSRSTDVGKTWQPVGIEAKTPQLAAGSAPTNTVCWIVGRAGTVLLSTDATTFRQVTKPADADLVSVRATDARSATVRTADGRTFATTDGGVTWTPAKN